MFDARGATFTAIKLLPDEVSGNSCASKDTVL